MAVAGDPDRGVVTFAVELGAELEAMGLVAVGDRALAEALLGQSAGDGSTARQARARLARNALSAAAEIGDLSSADAVVVVQRAEPHVRVFDVGAGAFYRNTEETAESVARAVRAARRRAALDPSQAAELASQSPAPPPPAERPARRFFRKNGPYFVGALLLAGAITWVVVESQREDPEPQTILRFRPGP
ncbi:MAG: hypothetical protein AAF411_16370 [Myxococcota bacterium]